MPNGHICHRSFQDPFHVLFKVENGGFEIVELMFGDQNVSDLDSHSWIDTEMDWLYKLA